MRVALTVPVLLTMFACGTTEPPIVSVVEVAQAELTLLILEGETLRPIQFTATALDGSGETISGKEFTWASSDTRVATIESSTGLATLGSATFVGSGTTTISATTDGVTGSTPLTVTVLTPPQIAASVESVAFVGVAGAQSPGAIVVEVTNGRGGTLGGLVVGVAFPTGQPQGWLTAVLVGTSTPATLTLTPQTATMPLGNYAAMIRLSSPEAANSPLVITVSLSLTAASTSVAVVGP